MRAAFIPALPPSALLAGMIAPSFRLVNRFCGKKLLRTCGPKGPPALCALFSRSPLAYVLLRTFGRRERPPALCAIFSWSPLAYVLLRTCGRRERPPALCAVWAWSPLACGRVPYPSRSLNRRGGRWPRPPLVSLPTFGSLCHLRRQVPTGHTLPSGAYARCGMGRLCGERRRRKRCERPSGARNAACSTRHRPPPGLPPAPAVGWFGGVRRPLQVYSESSDMRGGFGGLASARRPYAGRRPAKPAAKPPAK